MSSFLPLSVAWEIELNSYMKRERQSRHERNCAGIGIVKVNDNYVCVCVCVCGGGGGSVFVWGEGLVWVGRNGGGGFVYVCRPLDIVKL